jgi:hypothetical protein
VTITLLALVACTNEEITDFEADAILADPALREPGGQYVDQVFVGARGADDRRHD